MFFVFVADQSLHDERVDVRTGGILDRNSMHNVMQLSGEDKEQV